MTRWLRVLLGSAESSPEVRANALFGLRLLAGMLWLYNVGWKVPPEFGRDTGRGLYGYVQGAVDEPLLAPYSWVLEHVVIPLFPLFGWGVVIIEASLAAFILTGAWTRLWGLIGAAQALAIGLSVIARPGEWPWGYFMLIGIHLVLAFTSAGTYHGVDGARRRRDEPGVVVGALRTAGLLVVAVGGASLLLSFFRAPTASPGLGFRSIELEATLGLYNTFGALVLVGLGLLLLLAARHGTRGPAATAGVLAALATATVLLTWGRGPVPLGGDGTTAAAYLTVAVTAFSLAALLPRFPAHKEKA